ncbi:MAG: PilZ domain-containing protein [Deltaproteobacteria bacterium]|nr:PilZ domain-containing protein [Deltaproteobacteria bacterium]MBW2396235.1 PilZ domain-containing protein [Deltaproteobacteria bacterium]
MQDRWIWLVDDGELEDVRFTLEAAGLPVQRGPIDPGWRGSGQPVLLGSLARVADLREQYPGALSIAVIASDERAPRLPLDGWIRRPLHPFALAALLEALSHPGADRRWAPRVAVGAATRVWTRHGFRRATLVDLSQSGGRFLCETPVEVGSRMLVWLPPAPGFRWPRRIGGRVLRCEPNAWERPMPHAVALAFTSLPLASRRRLQALLLHHAGARLVPARPRPSDALTMRVVAPAERRRYERRPYDRRVIAQRPDGPVVLRARDLSVAGLRIEPDEGLRLGSELSLAIQVRPGTTPLVLDARVTRDDGPAGMVMQFEGLDLRRRDHLAKMLRDLPDAGQANAELLPADG